jgi:hypothetical protein
VLHLPTGFGNMNNDDILKYLRERCNNNNENGSQQNNNTNKECKEHTMTSATDIEHKNNIDSLTDNSKTNIPNVDPMLVNKYMEMMNYKTELK